MSLFKRKPHTTPAPAITPEDRLIAAYSGFTPEQWVDLPEPVRRNHREHIIWRIR